MRPMSAHLTVARRFRGPSTSANGGYICGLVAALAPASVTVRLLRPPPLDTRLSVEPQDGRLDVLHGTDVIAQARPGDVGELAVPPAPSRDEAVQASRHYAGAAKHPAPECFVCGPRREAGDGLCIFPGQVGPDGVVAAPWTPDASLDDGRGMVRPEFVWAALDCPGFIAAAPDMRSMLLGEMTARIERPVRIGEPCTVIGWPIGSSGRKHETGTALFGADGRRCGCARALWIEPRQTTA
jgi:hypothetical protein